MLFEILNGEYDLDEAREDIMSYWSENKKNE